MTFRAFATALLLTAASAAFAQAPSTTHWPNQKEGDFVIKDFRFKSGETLPALNIHYTTLGTPQRNASGDITNAVILLHGTSSSGKAWLMPSLGTVETLQPIAAAPPNLRDEMCGGHRKRPATEDEDDVVAANTGPESPYAVFLSSLRPPKTKGAALLQDSKIGEPVLVYTGVKPPAPGSA